MNSLKYITIEIEWLISRIKRFEERLAKYNNKDLNKEDLAEVEISNNWLEQYKEELQILLQIKTELEAWKVVKDEIKVKEVLNYFNPQYRICLRCINGLINKEQYEIIKKALEIKDE